MGTPYKERVPTMTLDEYLALDETAQIRHEFMEGYVRAMSGGTQNHSALKMNLYRELGTRLRGKSCRPFDSDFRVTSPKHKGYFYPDASVFCGPVEEDEKIKNTGINPTVIFEVLSESSEVYDRGTKFACYRACETLLYYVLISQKIPVVEVYHRASVEDWLFTAHAGLSSVIRFKEIGLDLPLADLYEGIVFPPDPESPSFNIKEDAAAYAAP